MRLLLIEDDVSLCRSLELSLGQQGFEVTVCHDGEVLLDRMLPGMDGMELLAEARREGCTAPVIFLTAMGELEDRIQGLDAGADDYLAKPFAFEELMARIRCVCRRPKRLNLSRQLSWGDVIYDPQEYLLTRAPKSCTLSRREGDLLTLFLQNPDQVLPRSTILMRVWGPDAEVESGNLDNYIHFLRRRLKSVDSRLGHRLPSGKRAVMSASLSKELFCL